MKKKLRIYLDTSVFGGCFDEIFSEPSKKLLAELRSGKFCLVISETTVKELEAAPDDVKDILNSIPKDHLELIEHSEEIYLLRDAYIEAKVVGKSSLLDAEHIAAASVANVDLIVSWNFKHIVHFDKIRGYHGINLIHGYSQVAIHNPKEVISNDDD